MTHRRQVPTLGPPPADPDRLAGFPSHFLSPELPLFRVARKGYDPWWFSSSLEGRFDLHEPYGTCYLAAEEMGALLELIGPDLESGAVSADFFRERRLWELRVPRKVRLADTTSRKASGFGVTAEIGSIVPYELPQAWAARLRAAAFGGLLYWLRHDPSRTEGYALFGPRGERKSWNKSWEEGQDRPISGELIERLESECSIEVLPVPRFDQLRIIE